MPSSGILSVRKERFPFKNGNFRVTAQFNEEIFFGLLYSMSNNNTVLTFNDFTVTVFVESRIMRNTFYSDRSNYGTFQSLLLFNPLQALQA